MNITEPRHPPPEYLPERVYKKPRVPPRPVFEANDLPNIIYKDWSHDCWALRHWRTGDNCHVEHWHGYSTPGRVR